MTETAEKLKGQLSQLSSLERAELAQFLIHSLDEETEADAESAWDLELARRMEEIQSKHAGAMAFYESQRIGLGLDLHTKSLSRWL